MSPRTKTLAPFLALFIFCFAAQGVSSSSIGTWNNEDIYSEQSTVTEILSLGTGLYSARAPAIITCIGHYINDIKEVAVRFHAVSADALKVYIGISADFAKCADDLKCKVDAVVNGVSDIMKVFNEARAWLSDMKMVVSNVSKCTQEGGPTPAPPPTTTTPPPTTVPPTTVPPTTVPPTTVPPTTVPPTTVPPTTVPPTTVPPTTAAPTTKPPQPTQPTTKP